VCGVCCVCVCIVCSLSYILFFHREGNRFKKMGGSALCVGDLVQESPPPPPPHLQDVIDRKILCKSGKYFLNGIFRAPGGGGIFTILQKDKMDFIFTERFFIEFEDLY
jgi:hypothetical protein